MDTLTERLCLTLRSERDALSTKCHQLTQHNARLQNQLRDTMQQMDQLQQSSQLYQSQADSQAKQLDDVKKRIKLYSSGTTDPSHADQYYDVHSELTILQQEKQNYSSNLAVLKESLVLQQQQHQEELQEQINKIQEALHQKNELQQQLLEYQDQVKVTTQSHQATHQQLLLQEQESQAVSLQCTQYQEQLQIKSIEIDDLQKTFQELEQEKRQLCHSNEELIKEIKQNKEQFHIESIVHLQNIEGLKEQKQNLAVELAALKAQSADLNQKQLVQLRQINEEQEKLNADRKYELQRIKILYSQEKEEKEEAIRKIEYLQRRLQKIEGSQQEYEMVIGAYTQLHAKAQQQMITIQNLQQQTSSQPVSMAPVLHHTDHSQEIHEKNITIASLEKKLAQMEHLVLIEQEIFNKENMVQQYDTPNYALMLKTLQENQQALDSHEAQKQQYYTQIKQLESKVESMSSNSQQQAIILEQLKAQSKRDQVDIQQKENELKEQYKRVHQAQLQVDQIQQERVQYKRQMEQLVQERDSLEKRLVESKRREHALRTERQDMVDSMLKQQNTYITLLRSQSKDNNGNKELHTQLASLDLQLIEANQRVAELQANTIPQVVYKEVQMEIEEHNNKNGYRSLDERDIIDLEAVQQGIQLIKQECLSCLRKEEEMLLQLQQDIQSRATQLQSNSTQLQSNSTQLQSNSTQPQSTLPIPQQPCPERESLLAQLKAERDEWHRQVTCLEQENQRLSQE